MMHRWLPRASTTRLFIGFVLVSAILHGSTGRWNLRWEPDSISYVEFDWSSVEGVLRGIRTPGYPLFLRITAGIFGMPIVPVAHWFALMLAVATWRYGLLRIGFREGSTLWAAAPLLFSSATWDMGRSVASDSLGVSLCIAGCGLFLAAMSHDARWWHWLALSAVTLSAILVRPAYLFLLPLWPVAAAWFSIAIFRLSRQVCGRKIFVTAIASLLPFLGYCSLRSATVGEFGLVSFAGYNLIGITGQYLNEEDVSRLDGVDRQVAGQMIARRDQVVDYARPDSYETMVRLYNATVWVTAAPAAQEVMGDKPEACNATLQSLALRSLSLHRWEYASWLIQNGKSMMEQLLRGALTECGSKLALLALVAIMLMQVFRNPPVMVVAMLERVRPSTELQLLGWLCMGVMAAKGCLVILIEPALGRYVAAAGCLVPALVGWVCGSLAENLVESRRKPQE